MTSNGQQLKQLSKSSSHLKVTNSKSANYNGGQYTSRLAIRRNRDAKHRVSTSQFVSTRCSREAEQIYNANSFRRMVKLIIDLGFISPFNT
ncbi:MAG TPA: hypothetical protein ENF37_09280 [Beggiatoa sp.]|nr:hypothetical protein [Beggiatoa sp.]